MLFRSAPLLFILTNSRCGSTPYLYTAHFSLPQRPRFLYLPFLAAAAPSLFILPISRCGSAPAFYTDQFSVRQRPAFYTAHFSLRQRPRSEEHTSELQSHSDLVCRLLLEKKNNSLKLTIILILSIPTSYNTRLQTP